MSPFLVPPSEVTAEIVAIVMSEPVIFERSVSEVTSEIDACLRLSL